MKVSSILQFSTFIKCNYDYDRSLKPLPVPIIEERKDENLKEAPLETLKAYNLSFEGYSCELKRLYKKGKVKIDYSFYGGPLSKKKVSIEHIIPRSKGGESCQANYVFCNSKQNTERGNNPLINYIDWEAVGIYLKQFEGVRAGGFNGDQYIQDVLGAIRDALRKGV